MADAQTITVQIKAQDEGSPVFEKFKVNAEKTIERVQERTNSMVESVKDRWQKLASMVETTTSTIEKARGIADSATKKFNEQTAPFQGDSSLSNVKNNMQEMASVAGVSDSVLRKVYGVTESGTKRINDQRESVNGLAAQYDKLAVKAEEGLQKASGGIERVAGAKGANAVKDISKWISSTKSDINELRDKYGAFADKIGESEKALKGYVIVADKVKQMYETLGNGADSAGNKMERLSGQVTGLAAHIGGETGKNIGRIGSNMKGMSDIVLGKDKNSAEQKELTASHEQKLGLLRAQNASEDKIKAAARSYDLKMEQLNQQKKMQLASHSFGVMAGLMGAFYTASGKKNREAFEAAKALSIAQAVMDTYAGATKAYAQGGMFGWVSAAAIIAAGLANVAMISQQQPDGGGGNAAVASVGASAGASSASTGSNFSYEQSKYGTGWRPGEGNGPGSTQTAQAKTVINVNGDVYAQDGDAFKKKVNEAVQQDIKDNGKTKDVIKRYA